MGTMSVCVRGKASQTLEQRSEIKQYLPVCGKASRYMISEEYKERKVKY